MSGARVSVVGPSLPPPVLPPTGLPNLPRRGRRAPLFSTGDSADGPRQLWATAFQQSIAFLRDPMTACRVVTGKSESQLSPRERRLVRDEVLYVERAWWSPGSGAEAICAVLGWPYRSMRRALIREGLLEEDHMQEGIDLTSQIRAVKREIAMRQRFYAKQVRARKMTQEEADYGVDVMRAVLRTLEGLTVEVGHA